jgi:hypothetical protein
MGPGAGRRSREGSVASAIKNSTTQSHLTGNGVYAGTKMRTEVLIFDLDGTLYDASSGYVDHIRSNIFEFMYEKVRSP